LGWIKYDCTEVQKKEFVINTYYKCYNQCAFNIFLPVKDPLGLKFVAIMKTRTVFITKNKPADSITFNILSAGILVHYLHGTVMITDIMLGISL
jgi:hypothetical protein